MQDALMPDVMESDEYESPALFWLYREIKRLDSTLAAIGVSDRSVRREACESYFFDIQEGLTAPVAAGGGEYTPLLLMIGPHGQWLSATDMFDFHEYASAIVGEFYDTEG